MTLAAVRTPAADSVVARWDARWKLAAVVTLMATAAVVRQPATAGVVLGIAVTLAVIARIPRGKLVARLGLLLLAVLPFVIVGPFILDPTGPGWHLGPLHVSTRGLGAAVAVACRCLAIGAFALVLLSSAPLPTTFAAARSLGLPAVLSLIGQLTFRYAGVLMDEARRLRTAARVRGFRPRASASSHRTLGHLAGAVLVRGGERAERVSAAMAARGFDGTPRTLTTFRATWRDAVGFTICGLLSAALLMWDWL